MISIRKYRRNDARAVVALISDTYACFNSQEGTGEAVRDYIESYAPKGKRTDVLGHRGRTAVRDI